MSKRYFKYLIEGSARNNQTWSVSGEVFSSSAVAAYMEASADVFRQLTEGKAVYGRPGTCQGPYQINRIQIEPRPEGV